MNNVRYSTRNIDRTLLFLFYLHKTKVEARTATEHLNNDSHLSLLFVDLFNHTRETTKRSISNLNVLAYDVRNFDFLRFILKLVNLRIRFTSLSRRGVGLSIPPRKPNTLGVLRNS